jgi:hypothetical protein
VGRARAVNPSRSPSGIVRAIARWKDVWRERLVIGCGLAWTASLTLFALSPPHAGCVRASRAMRWYASGCWIPGVYCCPTPARRTLAIFRDLETAVLLYQNDHEQACPPSLSTLVEEKYVSRAVDGWGEPLRFTCPGVHQPDGVDVISAGRDAEWETDDDLHSWDARR